MHVAHADGWVSAMCPASGLSGLVWAGRGGGAEGLPQAGDVAQARAGAVISVSRMDRSTARPAGRHPWRLALCCRPLRLEEVAEASKHRVEVRRMAWLGRRRPCMHADRLAGNQSPQPRLPGVAKRRPQRLHGTTMIKGMRPARRPCSRDSPSRAAGRRCGHRQCTRRSHTACTRAMHRLAPRPRATGLTAGTC